MVDPKQLTDEELNHAINERFIPSPSNLMRTIGAPLSGALIFVAILIALITAAGVGTWQGYFQWAAGVFFVGFVAFVSAGVGSIYGWGLGIDWCKCWDERWNRKMNKTK